jgi:hypothetical protein
MKKLALSVAVVLGCLSVSAKTAVSQEQIKIAVNVQTEYTEVAADAVPAAVKKNLLY